MKLLHCYLLLINIVTGTAFGWDKWQSGRRGQRIQEATLWRLALLGGSLGGILAMYIFRHKTRHRKFVWVLPSLLLFQAAAYCYITSL